MVLHESHPGHPAYRGALLTQHFAVWEPERQKQTLPLGTKTLYRLYPMFAIFFVLSGSQAWLAGKPLTNGGFYWKNQL